LSLAEVRTGLQTGLINTITTSPIAAITLQWHTQVNYLLDLPLLYLYGFLAVESRSFERISVKHQQVVRDIMGRVFRDIGRQNRKDNDKALEALRKQGIKFIKPSAETIHHWKDLASVVSGRLIERGSLSKQILNMLNGHLETIP
jgi:TRAP-type C4-dicarboxylate transport system substrate-binding protein